MTKTGVVEKINNKNFPHAWKVVSVKYNRL